MDKNLEKTVLNVTSTLEKELDEQLESLENIQITDLEQIRTNKLNQLKRESEQKMKWKQMGHGIYTELPDEKSFFAIGAESERVVCHFYQNSAERCKIVDMHLSILAPKHIETRFIKVEAPKCPFLAERLKIKVLPTILMVKDKIVIDRIVGFTDLGNRDDFSTAVLEWRLARSNIIHYEGDLSEMPGTTLTKKPSLIFKKGKRTIRELDSGSDSDD